MQRSILTTVEGNLRTQAARNAELPMLTSVGGHVKIDYRAALPQLASIGGNVSIYYPVEMPALECVGGYLDIGRRDNNSAVAYLCGRSSLPFR